MTTDKQKIHILELTNKRLTTSNMRLRADINFLRMRMKGTIIKLEATLKAVKKRRYST